MYGGVVLDHLSGCVLYERGTGGIDINRGAMPTKKRVAGLGLFEWSDLGGDLGGEKQVKKEK